MIQNSGLYVMLGSLINVFSSLMQNNGFYVVLGSIIGGTSSLLGTLLGTWLTQKSIEKRETRTREHQERIDQQKVRREALFEMQDTIERLIVDAIYVCASSKNPNFNPEGKNYFVEAINHAFILTKLRVRTNDSILDLRVIELQGFCASLRKMHVEDADYEKVISSFHDAHDAVNDRIGELLHS